MIAKRLTALQIGRSIDALPCVAENVRVSVDAASSGARLASSPLAQGLAAPWLAARTGFEGPTNAVADFEWPLAHAFNRPDRWVRNEPVLALKVARSSWGADGHGVVWIVTGLMIRR